jgi:glycosyl transferase family 25
MSIYDNLECLLINLDRSPERLLQMQERLEKLNLPFKRVSAVDGKQVEFTSREIDSVAYEKCHGKYVTPTEVACYISHYNALKVFLEESNKEFALILEDDMVFCEDFLMVLDSLLKQHKNWDMVKLNGTSGWGGPVIKNTVYNDYKLVLHLFHQAKSGAYLVNRKAAKNYIEKLLPMSVPYDHEFIKFWKYQIRLFSVIPFPTWEKQESSTIDYAMIKKNKKPWYKRGSTLMYRMTIIVKRLWSGLFLTN